MSLPETQRLDSFGLPDLDVLVAPGVTILVWEFPLEERIISIHYSGRPEALIAARVCTPEMLVAPEGLEPYGARGRRAVSFEGVDSCGRPFDLQYHFKYRRGSPRILRSATVSYRWIPRAIGMTLPWAYEGLARARERERLIEEQNRRDAQMARRGHLRLVVDNTREMRS